MDNQIVTIDIDHILRTKAGKKARWIPKFVVSFLKHIVHQDWVNDFLIRAKDLQGSAWLWDCLNYQDIQIEIKGKENLPDKNDGKRYTFVSNHPLGGIDGIAVAAVIGKKYDDRFKYLVNDLLMFMPGLAPLCIGINKTGAQSRNFPQMVEEGFKGDHHLVMFPAGICSRRQNGVIRDLPWKKTFITKSIETQRDIVPIHFEGRNSDFFYSLANLCKRLGIKFNIAMLFLADEMYKNNHKKFTITIGKPIPYTTFDKSKNPTEWAQWVKEQVEQL